MPTFPQQAYALAIRRCSHRPSRYRWTITGEDGRHVEHATESYPTAQAAVEAGRARADTLNARAVRGYPIR